MNCYRLIVNMCYAFQDRENLYLVMDLLTGGDLRYHICCQRKFAEDQTSMFISFYVANLVKCDLNHLLLGFFVA